jgi:hypothetical protein
MKIATMQVSTPETLKQFYRDYSSPEPAKYRVDLNKEAPALQQKIESLNDEERQRYKTTFIATWNSLPPTTRQMMLGGVAGVAAGAGLALATLSISEIGRLIGGPVGFAVGVTVLGVVGGALTPAALNHFTQNNTHVVVKTPALWNVVLPQATLEFEGASSAKTSAAKP